jgi:exopolyphosphatase/pppGpp-phosphohydrolase
MTRVNSQVFLQREELLHQWVDRKLGSTAHERRVARLADLFFEVTHPWHNLTRGDARLLHSAAWVHDVGRAGGAAEHEIRGARMVMSSALPLGDAERRRLAFLTRYHKGRVHDPDDLEYFDPSLDRLRELRLLLALLRAADGLDGRDLDPPHTVVTIQGRILTVHAYVVGDAEAVSASLGRPKKFRMLETLLRCQVQVRWIPTETLALAH